LLDTSRGSTVWRARPVDVPLGTMRPPKKRKPQAGRPQGNYRLADNCAIGAVILLFVIRVFSSGRGRSL